jgi:hypothetical protein
LGLALPVLVYSISLPNLCQLTVMHILDLADPSIKSWDKTTLLEWIQKKLNVPLDNEDADKLLSAKIGGNAFLFAAGRKEIFQEAGIPLGPSVELAQLAQTIVDGESKCSFLADNPYHFLSSIFLAPAIYHAPLLCAIVLYMHISQLTTSQGTANKAGLRGCPL